MFFSNFVVTQPFGKTQVMRRSWKSSRFGSRTRRAVRTWYLLADRCSPMSQKTMRTSGFPGKNIRRKDQRSSIVSAIDLHRDPHYYLSQPQCYCCPRIHEIIWACIRLKDQRNVTTILNLTKSGDQKMSFIGDWLRSKKWAWYWIRAGNLSV